MTVNDARIGRLIRAARQRRGWRQLDVEHAAGIDQTTQSLIERGHLSGLTLTTIRRSAAALELDVELEVRGASAYLVRLLDERHASLVECVVAILRAHGWVIVAEYTFNHFGERGSVDVLAWHPKSSTLLIVEVKTRIVDVQELLATFDRKCRLMPKLVRSERGWDAATIGRLLVVEEGATQRRAVRAHAQTFASVLSGGSREARQWVRTPVGAIGAVWFLSPTTLGRGSARNPGSRRVRSARSRSATQEPAVKSVVPLRERLSTTNPVRT